MKEPVGWTHTTFDRHVDCLTGFAFKSLNYSSGESDIRLLRGDNIEPGNLRWHNAKFWPDLELEGLEKYQLLEGDFVIALDRTWISSGLKVAEVKKSDLPCLLVQRVARIRSKSTLEQSLLRQYFSGHSFDQYVKSVQTATAVPHISPNDIKNFPVALPPLPEQKKIAQILTTWDKAITTTEQLLANSQQQKKSLMQQLLTGKKRLLDKNGVRYIGEWRESLVEDFFDVGSSKRVLQKDWQAEGVPFYRTRELVSLVKNEPLRSEIFISEKLFSELSEQYGCPHSGDFLVSGVGTLGIVYQITPTDRFYFKDGNVLWFKLKTGIYSDYFRYCFQSDFMQDQIMAQASVTTVGTYTIKNAKKTKLLCPPTIEEQQKIATVLSTADQEINVLRQKINALKKEKKSLMQQLLTGKCRVVVDRENTEVSNAGSH